jgi:hypothetical protein
VSLTLCAGVDTSGVSAGTVGLLIRYLDGGGATLSESAITAIANGAASKRFMAQGVTPATTASVQVIVRYTGVTVSVKGTRVRNPKLERGTVPTPFTDDQSPYRWRYMGQYNLGKGIITVAFTLGDGTTTQSSYDLRSAAGAQAYDVRLKSTGGTNGTPGKGLATLEAGALAATGPVGYTAELNAGNAGAALSINMQAAAYQKCTLNAATSAISFDSTTPPLVVGRTRLKIIQDATGGRATTWPTGAGKITVVWQGGTVPTPATAAAAVTFVDLYWDGTTLYGSWTPWS